MLAELTRLITLTATMGLCSHFLFVPNAVGKRYFLYHGTPGIVAAALVLGLTDYQTILFLVFALLGCAFSKQHVYFFSLACAFGFVILSHGQSRLGTATLILSSLFTGHTLGNLCLGHWYLNVPKLPVSLLRRTTLILFVCFLIRFGFGTYFLTTHDMKWLLGNAGLFFLMRYVWGLVAPLGLFYFIWDTVKLGSTQSATGLYYVLTIMVLIGEIVSLYLLTAFEQFS